MRRNRQGDRIGRPTCRSADGQQGVAKPPPTSQRPPLDPTPARGWWLCSRAPKTRPPHTAPLTRKAHSCYNMRADRGRCRFAALGTVRAVPFFIAHTLAPFGHRKGRYLSSLAANLAFPSGVRFFLRPRLRFPNNRAAALIISWSVMVTPFAAHPITGAVHVSTPLLNITAHAVFVEYAHIYLGRPPARFRSRRHPQAGNPAPAGTVRRRQHHRNACLRPADIGSATGGSPPAPSAHGLALN